MKFEVTRTDGTDNSGKTYLVVNTDEPYAGEVADLIENEERRKGTWEHGDKTLREVMGIPATGQNDFEIGVNEQDLIDEGVLCHECGTFIGQAIGQQRLCENCKDEGC